MKRVSCLIATVTVTLATQAMPARAQFNVIFPGSTVQGDILRGDGESAYGWGLYNHHSALGRAIDADTWLRLDANIAQAEWARARYRHVRFERSKAIVRLALEANQRRIRESPTEADVLRGDALNALARELRDPRFGSAALRSAAAPVPVGVLGRVPLHLARANLLIAPDRLKAEGRWPMPLQGPNFASGRRAYDRAIGTALGQAARGAVTAEAVAAVDRAILDLRDGWEADAQVAPASARAFLDRLTRSARMFHDAEAGAALTAVLNAPGRTTAELLETMGQHHLQFGAAETSAEQVLYRELYSSLVRQRGLLVARHVPLHPGVTDPGPNPGLASLGVIGAFEEPRHEGDERGLR